MDKKSIRLKGKVNKKLIIEMQNKNGQKLWLTTSTFAIQFARKPFCNTF